MKTLIAAPDPIPSSEAPRINKLQSDAHLCMNAFQVPYFIQGQLAEDGFVTLADLADRWPDKATARTSGPKDYGFLPNSNGYDDKSSLRTAVRLAQAVESAMHRRTSQRKHELTDAINEATVLLQPGQRSSMEAQYELKSKLPKPSLDKQGSDHFLGMLHKACSRGEIGYFTNRQIIAQIPETTEDSSSRKKRRTDADGIIHEFDEEERWDPTSMDQWKKQMTVFKNSILMCTWMFPQFASFDVDVPAMDDFYEFLFGPNIATRTPSPSLKVLMVAERKVWRQIALDLHKGITLKSSLAAIRTDSLFWQREVYERLHNPASGGIPDNWSPRKEYLSIKGGKGHWEKPKSPKGGKGNRYGLQPQADSQPYPPPYIFPSPKGTGKPTGKGKGKGKVKGIQAKGKPTVWPSKWATMDSKGKQYCRLAILSGTCSGGCGRSHQCPVIIKTTGVPCNGSHTPDACPHK